MSFYQSAREMAKGTLTYVPDWLSYPVQMVQNGFGTATTTVTATATETAAVQQTPLMWARDFPAVPPQLIHELSLRWIVTFIEGMVSFVGSLGTIDLVWHLFLVPVIILLFVYRRPLRPRLSQVWEELKQDVQAVVQRQFFPPCEELPPASDELPPNTALISAADIEDLNASADAIQQRMNHLRMSRINFVRSRTGIVYNLNSSRKLQIELAKAREALRKEQASHQDTQDFLDHQSNARADAEDGVETLRARLETERPELDENTRLGDIPEEAECGAVQVERLQNQLRVEQASYSAVFKKKEIFRHGGLKLKKQFEDLQADYNLLEDVRDSYKETLEALEEQTDVKAVKALHAKMDSDKEHYECRIDALETQLKVERNGREEAERVSRELSSHQEELEECLDMAISANDGLEAATMDLDTLHDPSHRAREEPVYVRFEDDEEVKKLMAEQARLTAEREQMDRDHEEEMNARRGTATEGESWQTYQFAFQPTQGTTLQERIPHRRTQSAPLWLPPPHHGDTFDPLYDVSDYGDDDRDSEDGDKGRDEESRDDRVREGGSGNDGGDGAREEDSGDDDDLDDSRDGGADKVAADAGLVQEHHITELPVEREDTLSLGSHIDHSKLPADPPTPEPSPPSIMNASATEFVPSVRSGQSLLPITSGQMPSFKAAEPGRARNPHIQKLNQEVERREWRRMRGMPESAEGREGDVILDDTLGKYCLSSCLPSVEFV